MCAHNESWIVAAHCDVLRPGSRCQAEDEDEHGYNEQHHCHNYGFPLPPLKGTCEKKHTLTVNTVGVSSDVI